MARGERDLTHEQEQRVLLEGLDRYSAVMSEAGYDESIAAAKSLIGLFEETDPDNPPVLSPDEHYWAARAENFGVISTEQLVALTIARDFSAKVQDQLVGWGNPGQESTLEELDRNYSKWFFERWGKAIQGILHPNGPYGREHFYTNFVLATKHYHQLLLWDSNHRTDKSMRNATITWTQKSE